MTFGSAMNVLLSVGALILTLIILRPAYRILKNWDKGNDEEKYDLEKSFYLTYSAVIVILGIRIFLIPLYFWTMQSFVPMVPGAMCLWGVFEASPETAWLSLFLKLIVPIGYIGWILLSYIDAECKTHPLMKNMMVFFIVLSPLVLLDSLLDLLTFLRMEPVQVACCSDAIDVWSRPVPGFIGGLSGQTILVGVFFVFAIVFTLFLFLSLSRSFAQKVTLFLSLPFAAVLVLTITEVFTPWLLNLPFHHCPFCLFFLHPLSILFSILLWFAIGAPWLVTIVQRLGQNDSESLMFANKLEKEIISYAVLSIIIAISLITVDLLVSFSI